MNGRGGAPSSSNCVGPAPPPQPRDFFQSSCLDTAFTRQKMFDVCKSDSVSAVLLPRRGSRQLAQGVATRHESQTLGTNKIKLEPRRGDQRILARKRDRELSLVAPSGLEFRGHLPRVCPRPSDYTLGYLPAAPPGQKPCDPQAQQDLHTSQKIILPASSPGRGVGRDARRRGDRRAAG